MYALLAICTTLAPGPVDDASGIIPAMKEQLGDKLAELSRGCVSSSAVPRPVLLRLVRKTDRPLTPTSPCRTDALDTFQELYLSACPKFISANPPPYEDPSAYALYVADPPIDPPARHVSLFLSDVTALSSVPQTRSLLKLYTSIGAAKLGKLVDEDEERVLEDMMVLKLASRTYRHKGEDGGLMQGSRVVNNNLDFFVDNVRLSPSLLPSPRCLWPLLSARIDPSSLPPL